MLALVFIAARQSDGGRPPSGKSRGGFVRGGFISATPEGPCRGRRSCHPRLRPARRSRPGAGSVRVRRPHEETLENASPAATCLLTPQSRRYSGQAPRPLKWSVHGPPHGRHGTGTATAQLPACLVPTIGHPGEGWMHPGERLRSSGDGLRRRARIATAVAGGGGPSLTSLPPGLLRPDVRLRRPSSARRAYLDAVSLGP